MNKTILMGRLTKDPEVKYLQNENSTAMARYTLAVDRRYRKDGKAETDFISCVTFGKNAEFAEKCLKKGLKILVSGRIQTGSYVNQEGNKVYATNVIVEEHYFAEGKKLTGAEKKEDTDPDGFMHLIELARRFVEEQLVARGMIADLAIHDPKKAKDKIPNPHMHIMVPIRPLKEDGTWGQKQKKVPVLTPDGQPVLNQKGQLVFRAVHTTDWSRKETLEELRSAWAKMCNELYEEKGLTERVDARSYEERGIDKIPMVHEGPNVQAMEARGISTALGSLNRLIRALNDMKERAKNLLQWSLLRQSQLMERMLFLHQPTLADYLRNYYDKRNAVAESYAYGTQKAKNTNLKQFAETIRFLEEQDVRTPEQLTEKIQEFDTQLNEVSQRLKKQLAALQRVNVNLYAMKEYFETRPVYLELKNKYFGREKFKEEHKKELSGYYRSERILKENLDANGKIPEGKWKREADCLSEEIAALRKEDKRIHAMLRKYEKVKNHVEVLMAEEGEGVSLPETNKREQSTETKEAVRTMKPKKKHHGMEL